MVAAVKCPGRPPVGASISVVARWGRQLFHLWCRSLLKKKNELSGLNGTSRFVWFAGRTAGSTSLVPIRPISDPIDRIGPKLWPIDGQTGRSDPVFKTMGIWGLLSIRKIKFRAWWISHYREIGTMEKKICVQKHCYLRSLWHNLHLLIAWRNHKMFIQCLSSNNWRNVNIMGIKQVSPFKYLFTKNRKNYKI